MSSNGDLPPLRAADAREAWRTVVAAMWPEIMSHSGMLALYRVGERVYAELAAEIAGLKSQLDNYQGRTVYHCTEANCAQAQLMARMDPAPQRSIIRATDTGREWELVGEDWHERAA